MTKATTKARLKQSIFDCLVKLELAFQDYSLIRNYNDFWRCKILDVLRFHQSNLKHFTKSRHLKLKIGIENLKN